ncbi:MAG: 50S ribosomal protein L23 [Candidatus Pacebacteria bacterium CG_4_10_14_0_8_um_filter_42_14]|nr:MAG: 50S ribosomal protein L23 [Candidatus Pacebacteria bacterium CG_4_10_14_0_8_um_filter_42_14]
MQSRIVKKPVITEKSYSRAKTHNVYTFEVEPSAGKDQIKDAIAKLFSVTVVDVRTLCYQSRTKRAGRRRLPSSTAKTKRAFVTLKSGETIDLFDLGAQE